MNPIEEEIDCLFYKVRFEEERRRKAKMVLFEMVLSFIGIALTVYLICSSG